MNDPDIRYVVKYNVSEGTVTVAEPPIEADQVITNSSNETTVEILAPNKRKAYTYYFWVAAISDSAEFMGEYSNRANGTTVISELLNIV